MKQFTIELDELICVWLTHISDITGESIESLIVSALYQQVEILEDNVNKAFDSWSQYNRNP